MDRMFETLCICCEGGGGWMSYGDWIECHKCYGTGYIPTELGEAVLELLRHNVKGVN